MWGKAYLVEVGPYRSLPLREEELLEGESAQSKALRIISSSRILRILQRHVDGSLRQMISLYYEDVKIYLLSIAWRNNGWRAELMRRPTDHNAS